MSTRGYGQYCGLARAVEIIGQRWAALIVRDLALGPRRYSDLLASLPGISTNMLATRLRELEQEGLAVRTVLGGGNRSVVYRLTPRGRDLVPALDVLARWGAEGMTRPRAGEVVTDASLATALRVSATPGEGKPARYTVRVGDATVHATVGDGTVETGTGEHPEPDLTIVAGPEFRDLLAGELPPHAATTAGMVELTGDPALFDAFLATFSLPYSTHLPASDQPEGTESATAITNPDPR